MAFNLSLSLTAVNSHLSAIPKKTVTRMISSKHTPDVMTQFLTTCTARPVRKREENKAKGLEYLRAGDKKKAFECFQKCVDVTPEMAYQVMKVRIMHMK